LESNCARRVFHTKLQTKMKNDAVRSDREVLNIGYCAVAVHVEDKLTMDFKKKELSQLIQV
jgi:hypothetical protein